MWKEKEEEEPETFYELNKVSFLHTWQEKKSTYFIYEIKLWGKVFLHFILHSFRFNSRTSKEAFKAQNKLFFGSLFPLFLCLLSRLESSLFGAGKKSSFVRHEGVFLK